MSCFGPDYQLKQLQGGFSVQHRLRLCNYFYLAISSNHSPTCLWTHFSLATYNCQTGGHQPVQWGLKWTEKNSFYNPCSLQSLALSKRCWYSDLAGTISIITHFFLLSSSVIIHLQKLSQMFILMLTLLAAAVSGCIAAYGLRHSAHFKALILVEFPFFQLIVPWKHKILFCDHAWHFHGYIFLYQPAQQHGCSLEHLNNDFYAKCWLIRNVDELKCTDNKWGAGKCILWIKSKHV